MAFTLTLHETTTDIKFTFTTPEATFKSGTIKKQGRKDHIAMAGVYEEFDRFQREYKELKRLEKKRITDLTRRIPQSKKGA